MGSESINKGQPAYYFRPCLSSHLLLFNFKTETCGIQGKELKDYVGFARESSQYAGANYIGH